MLHKYLAAFALTVFSCFAFAAEEAKHYYEVQIDVTQNDQLLTRHRGIVEAGKSVKQFRRKGDKNLLRLDYRLDREEPLSGKSVVTVEGIVYTGSESGDSWTILKEFLITTPANTPASLQTQQKTPTGEILRHAIALQVAEIATEEIPERIRSLSETANLSVHAENHPH
jgi:hypothetical protein